MNIKTNPETIEFNRIEDYCGARQCEVVGAEHVTVRLDPFNKDWTGHVDGVEVSWGPYANVAAARAIDATMQA